jgi:putative transposase
VAFVPLPPVSFLRWVISLDLPKRKLQRLRNYDYSQNGAYFVTICTHKRLCLFGQIKDKMLCLNDAGQMVFNRFNEIPQFYSGIEIDQFIVMPNHLHAILMINHSGTTQGSFPTMALPGYIQRFKSLTTRLYIEGVKNGCYPPFDKKLWQKSYYDHIIRSEKQYQKVSEYIQTNPLKWQEDKYFVV